MDIALPSAALGEESQFRRREYGATHILGSTCGLTFSGVGHKDGGFEEVAKDNDEKRVGSPMTQQGRLSHHVLFQLTALERPSRSEVEAIELLVYAWSSWSLWTPTGTVIAIRR